MNIFVLHKNPDTAARMMLDKHVVKMPTESMQMICTIMDLYGFETPMKPVMLNHPCTIWARESSKNFQWLVDHCLALCKEYTVRYGRKHKVEEYMEQYANEILEYFNAETLFQNIDSQKGFLKERIDLPKTKYEKNFINAGEKIFYLEYVRLEAVSTVA